jgi:hypothetical protein
MRVLLLAVDPTYQRLLAVATAVFLISAPSDKRLDKPLLSRRQSSGSGDAGMGPSTYLYGG